ncbi:aldo/keto reductase [Lophiostoma macrostomum CBS 122681]|uniref:Aldo/keto reductase n=1 Tax=Lophiostoma macrostomum CBS 122681 TaxID=1314788 RepID=A0A6A6SXB7_9PLEO|nr:aldo/keto reductase [Lophiostoma macrostomum CBS 122681]
MAASPNSDLKIVFGAMTIGAPGTLGARVHSQEDANAILDIFQEHGHTEVDTARLYGGGSSEEMLATSDWQARGLAMGTKLYPNPHWLPSSAKTKTYTHKPSDIDLFYLHGPDRATPFEDTLREVHKLYTEGLFTRWGLSNYYSWEVSRIVEICVANNWVKPTVYQGVYNALQRSIEPELVPCLRHYGIALYAFQPLAGGFLTGRYERGQSAFEAGSRFDPRHVQGTLHQGRYWNDAYFDALDVLRKVGEQHGLTVAEMALRWLKHHSALGQARGDAVIVGASSARHIELNLGDLEKGPLEEGVVEVMEDAWMRVKAVAPKYWH